MIGGVVMKVDNELVVKASKGNKDAFSDLYYSCYNDLYKFANENDLKLLSEGDATAYFDDIQYYFAKRS